jgi:hypothetical protein
MATTIPESTEEKSTFMKEIIIAAIGVVSTAVSACITSFAKTIGHKKEIEILNTKILVNEKEKTRFIEENATLKIKITDLKAQLNKLTEIPLTLKKGVYYDKEGNAFCPACRANALFVPLSRISHTEYVIEYKCPNCQNFIDARR